MEKREGCPTYMFYDGPPTANGKPHIGHVETRVIKDMIPRYHAMKGEQVVDYEINEALQMKKDFPFDLLQVASDVSI